LAGQNGFCVLRVVLAEQIGETLYHDTTPTRLGAHDGRCVKPQQHQPDMPLTQELGGTCSSRSANAILDRIQAVEDLDASSGTALKLASVYFLWAQGPAMGTRTSARLRGVAVAQGK
jgi:hypothetical protein